MKYWTPHFYIQYSQPVTVVKEGGQFRSCKPSTYSARPSHVVFQSRFIRPLISNAQLGPLWMPDKADRCCFRSQVRVDGFEFRTRTSAMVLKTPNMFLVFICPCACMYTGKMTDFIFSGLAVVGGNLLCGKRWARKLECLGSRMVVRHDFSGRHHLSPGERGHLAARSRI